MTTTLDRPPASTGIPPAPAPPSATPLPRWQRLLLGCGIAYAVLYATVPDLAGAIAYPGYSMRSQAPSELSAIGAPTRGFLTATLPVFAVLMMAFGVGVWRAASGRRSLRVTGALLFAFGATSPLWLLFPMTSREDMVAGTMPTNDAGHLAMAALTVAFIVAQLVSGAIALGTRFRIYSAISLATVLAFGAATSSEAAKLPDGDPTPWMGLFERINIWAWLLWMTVLAVTLLRRATARPAERSEP
jgi:hypothetical protein